jgi:quercetin dioxygenase-like cupin family protein
MSSRTSSREAKPRNDIPARRGGRKGISIVATHGKGIVLLPGEGETVLMPGNTMSFVHREPDSVYSIVEWVAEPGGPGSSLHIHRATDEAFYVLEGTLCFRLGEETVEASAGAFVFAPRGIVHAFWNQGPSLARMLVMMSPPGFVRYLEELANGLTAVGDDAEAAMSLRKELSEKYDIEVLGPPRQATG